MKRVLLLILCLFLLSPGIMKSSLPTVDAAESVEMSSSFLQATVKNWLCHKCSTKVQSAQRPSSIHCPGGGHHQWTNLGEVGETVYLCDKCSTKVKSKNRPSSIHCPAGGHHRWNRLAN